MGEKWGTRVFNYAQQRLIFWPGISFYYAVFRGTYLLYILLDFTQLGF